jgi:ribonuclease Z
MVARALSRSSPGCSRASGAKEGLPLELVPLSAGRVIDAGEFTVHCFRVRHRDTDSFGFSFESRARRHLQPDRLSALGVPDGPARKTLAGGRPLTLEDGRTIDPENVLEPPTKRKKLVVVGTETTEGLSQHVGDADVLVIEATFLDHDAEMALDCGHLTAAKAAALAAASNVKQLILTHISGRYTGDEILAEATRIFPNSRVAADLDRIVI